MKSSYFWKILFVSTIVIISCSKEGSTEPSCATDAPIERTIIDQAAMVWESEGKYYISEHNTIDTKLIPCNLDPSFAIDNLSVLVSGDVKKAPFTDDEPCCTNYFIITSITR